MARRDGSLTNEQLLDFYSQMILIRRFEEKVVELSGKGLVSGSTHPCIAQEAISVGAIAALNRIDRVLGTYRGHGQFLARGADPAKTMAEILCRSTGYCQGKGGSMHLSAPELEFLGTNAIVAAHIPIAGGVALADKLRKNGRVTACFFGDGASCEGVFYETANMAALWQVPLVLICENNGYAISVPAKKALSIDDIARRADGFGFPGVAIDGNDPVEVYDATCEAVDRAREGKGPTLIECKTTRWERHSALSAGYYETPEDRKRWQQVDPLPRFRRRLLGEHDVEETELEELEAEAVAMVEEAAQFALDSPKPEPSAAGEDIFA